MIPDMFDQPKYIFMIHLKLCPRYIVNQWSVMIFLLNRDIYLSNEIILRLFVKHRRL